MSSEHIINVGDLANVMHEFGTARSDMRRITDEISKSVTSSYQVDVQRLKTHAAELIDHLDWLDMLFEFLRIELNPDGIEYAPKGQYNMHGMFFRALHHFFFKINKKSIETSLTAEPGFTVEAYPSVQILPLIIIENAVKYSLKGGTIAIILDQPGRKVTVESQGPKIEQSELAEVFKKGVRGRNAALSGEGGQGLGLYIAKKICEAHGFDLSVTQARPFIKDNIPYCIVNFVLDLDMSKRKPNIA
jgi:light-regulated signal transduction histidine kinase (bacteriophytochrome)